MSEKPRAVRVWLLVAAIAGGAAGAAASLWGAGTLRSDAVFLGLLVAVFVFGLRFVRLRAPDDPAARRNASFTREGKRWTMIVLGVLAVGASGYATWQALQGYPDLEPAALMDPRSPPRFAFYTARGRPLSEVARYRMTGSEGDRWLVALDRYEARLLVILHAEPPRGEIVVTGRLRDDLKTAQRSADGTPQGSFVSVYREHMRLPEKTPIYFLDTSVRAGLNAVTGVLVGVPLYLLMLMIGVPTRSVEPPAPRRVSPDA